MTRLVAAALCVALYGPALAASLDGRRLRVADGRLVDQRGREITLRGVNARAAGIFDVIFDDGRLPLEAIPTFDADDAARMRSFGFNLLRLPINWSALESEQGRYSRDYLDRIAAVVKDCAKSDVLVILDFHQDAFSKEIGQDGAPRWVLDLLLGPNGYPYLGGPLTDLGARRFAPWTIQAFTRFDANDDDVQSLFAKAVVVLAKRFRKSRTVVGYEIMNEPLATWDAAGEAQLRALHVRVAQAIRTIDERHLVFFEPNSLRNAFNATLPPDGPFPVEGAVYSPHVYTYVFDGQTFTGDPAALVASMEHAADEAAAWGTPLFVGEYGIDPTHPLANEWITASLDLQDRLRAHSTFWLWEEISSGHWGLFDGESSEPGGERIGRTTTLSRAYARAVPGRVVEHAFDAAANTLRLRWTASARGPVELFVPPRRYPHGAAVTCDGTPVDVAPDERDAVARFRCGGRTGEHVVEVSPVP
jgi:endoglycosylceramidase